MGATFLGVQNAFLDTTFREGGAYFGMQKNFFWDTKKLFLGYITFFAEHYKNYKKKSKIIKFKKEEKESEKAKDFFFFDFSCLSNILI